MRVTPYNCQRNFRSCLAFDLFILPYKSDLPKSCPFLLTYLEVSLGRADSYRHERPMGTCSLKPLVCAACTIRVCHCKLGGREGGHLQLPWFNEAYDRGLGCCTCTTTNIALYATLAVVVVVTFTRRPGHILTKQRTKLMMLAI